MDERVIGTNLASEKQRGEGKERDAGNDVGWLCCQFKLALGICPSLSLRFGQKDQRRMVILSARNRFSG